MTEAKESIQRGIDIFELRIRDLESELVEAKCILVATERENIRLKNQIKSLKEAQGWVKPDNVGIQLNIS